MFNPHQPQASTIDSHREKICPMCKGAGKNIESAHGPKAHVFGMQNAQGECPSCKGQGFVKPVRWARHMGNI